ncbi:MAG: DUF983 domain-containing protein [Verrucomicrobiota bacterium]
MSPNPPDLQPLPRVTPTDLLKRGLGCRCPNCGKAKLFRSWLRIHHHCPQCGMTLERGDGYFLGPLCINYGMVAIGYVSPLLIVGLIGWIPFQLALGAALAGALLLPVVLYRYSWSWWLMIYYLCLPNELHANRPEDSDDLSFDEERRSP